MNILTAKPLAYLPPPDWFRELTYGVSRLLQPDLLPPHATKDFPETYLEDLKACQLRLRPNDRDGRQRTISEFGSWSHSRVQQPAFFWKRASLSVVEVVATPCLLRTTASLGTLDRNLKTSEQLIFWSSFTTSAVMRLGRTADGLFNRGGAHSVVRMCDMLGKLAANAFSVTLALDLALKDTFKLAALALCADGCRHVYNSFMTSDAFECTSTPDSEHLKRLSSRQMISSAIWNLHLAELCMDLADQEIPSSQFSDADRKGVNASMDNILGEDIAVATCFLLAQIHDLRAGNSSGSFRSMDEFHDTERLLTWRKCLELSEELSRLDWIANSSMKKQQKIAALDVPKLKTSLWQRISMRSAGDLLTDAMYPLKL